MTWDQVTGRVRAWLFVTGPGGAVAAVRLHYLDQVPRSTAEVSGAFRGRVIAATMPAP